MKIILLISTLLSASSLSLAQNYDMVVAMDGSGNYTSIQAAFNSVPDNSGNRTVIYIKNGLYKEFLNLSTTKKNVTLYGESYNGVTLTNDIGASQINPATGIPYGTSGSSATYINGEGFFAYNITFENSTGKAYGPALAIDIKADKAVFKNCRFLGNQNTMYCDSARMYFYNCYMEGTTDFIFGPSTAVFENCELHSYGGTALTAASTENHVTYGYVFLNCKITAESGVNTALGRSWSPYAAVAFLNCNLSSNIRPAGWDNGGDTANEATARYAEYNNTGTGANTTGRVSWAKQLTAAQAANYTVLNVLKTTYATSPVTDNWDPNTVISQTGNIAQGTLAFPTAEGFGRNTSGGRGGSVIEVTNLNNAGTGSFRSAVLASGKRTIVFRVSGIITLLSDIQITSGNLTIAGQTAPGDGICISNATIMINADNVIIRHMRFRHGNGTGGEYDAVWGRNRKNIILDHCSFSWANDEVASFYDNNYFTMQWCIISESFYHSTHPKGNHGYGGIWGGWGATFHHNLIAHHTSRNPRFCGARYHLNTAFAEVVDYRNNVVFNWGGNSSYGGEWGHHNMVNNYYKPGPATKSGAVRYRLINPSDTVNSDSLSKWYISGNVMEGSAAVTSDNWNTGVQPELGTSLLPSFKAYTPFAYAPVTMETATDAYASVLANSGATYPIRDAVDTRVSNEAKTGTVSFGGLWGTKKGIIDDQTQVGGYPSYNSTAATLDTDKDGMPDEWEKAYGTVYTTPDNNGDLNEDGYTNLEQYINCLVGEGTGCPVVVAGIEDEEITRSELNVFPNPFSEAIHIHTRGSFQYVIFNLSGAEVGKGAGQEITTIGTQLYNGVYIVKITSENKTQFLKITKVHE